MSDTLLLNADAQPVSVLPLSILNWQDAIRYMVLDKGRVLFWHEEWVVHSASWETQVPAVIMLHDYQKPKKSVRVSRKNIYLRDNYTCQYCGTRITEATATLDHVIPLSKGGKSNWTNLSTACKPCNYRKSDSIRVKPKVMPYRPDYYDLAEKRRRQGFSYGHPSWATFLG